MNLQDCIDFANKVSTSYFATDEGAQPRVRPLGMWFADKTGFYFQTTTPKAIFKQLEKNNQVEIVFHIPGPGGELGEVMRVNGAVEFLDDMALKEKVLQERPYLKPLCGIEKADDPKLTVFRITNGEAYFWSPEYNMRESEIERIKF